MIDENTGAIQITNGKSGSYQILVVGEAENS
jgi:hypothetical protein